MASHSPGVCFVAPNAYPVLAAQSNEEMIGGAEIQQVTIARELVKQGYEVSMICFDFGQQPAIEIDGIKVIRTHSRDAGIPYLRVFWPRFTGLWSSLKHANADIYYQRAAARATGVVALFCRRYKKKAIFAAAGNPDLFPKTPRIRAAWDRFVYRYGLRTVDRIVVQNVEQARLARSSFDRESTLIPNCYPEPRSAGSGPRSHILWVSTLRKLKRPDLYLDLAEQMPEHRFRMIGGPDRSNPELFREIQSRASSLPNVEFMGFVPYSDVDRYFDSAAIFVNTSESEGFPNTFLQAWARGVPTVSFIDCGARRGRQSVGQIVESLSDMKASISDLLGDSALYERVGGECRSHYHEFHTPSRVTSLYDRLFRELLDESE